MTPLVKTAFHIFNHSDQYFVINSFLVFITALTVLNLSFEEMLLFLDNYIKTRHFELLYILIEIRCQTSF